MPRELPDIDNVPHYDPVERVLGNVYNAAKRGFLAPGRALASTEPVTTEELLGPARDMAGMMVGGATPRNTATEAIKSLANITSETLGPYARSIIAPEEANAGEYQMAFDPSVTPYGGTRSFERPPPGAIPDLGAGENGVPDPQQQAPGTPTSAQVAPGSPQPARTTNYSQGGSVGYSEGGAIPEPGDEISGVDNDPSNDLTSALDTVKAALDYGRQLHGITGGDQAAAMPTIPGTQSESGIPRPRPGGPGTQRLSAAMPTIPGTQSESGIPPQRPSGPGTQKLSDNDADDQEEDANGAG